MHSDFHTLSDMWFSVIQFNVAFAVGSGGGDNNIVGAIAFAIIVTMVIVILITNIVANRKKGICIANITPI